MAKKIRNPKAYNILKLLNGGYSVKDIVERMAVSPAYIYMLKKQMAHKDEEQPEVETPQVAKATQEGGDHYKKLGIEPWDVFDTWPTEQKIGAYRANCTKYIMRLDQKDTPLLNAKKLRHYATKLVEVLEQNPGA